MKKRIICVVLTLVAVFSLFGFQATQAWFSDGKNKTQSLTSGALNFEAVGDFSFKTTEDGGNEIKVLPGTKLSLANPIEIKNTSSIDSEFRMKIECLYNEEPQSWISFVLNDEENVWTLKEESDGYTYIYYKPNGEGRLKAVESGESSSFSFDGSISIGGEVPYEFQNKELQINLVLQAKQADFMSWENFYNQYGIDVPTTDAQ